MPEAQQRLYLSTKNRVFGGVCGGIGEYFNIDPTMIRVLWVFLTFFGGSGILLYIIAYFVMPKNPQLQTATASAGSSSVILVVGSLMVAFGLILLLDNLDIISFHRLWHRSWEFALPVFLILVGVYLLARKSGANGTTESTPLSAPSGPSSEQPPPGKRLTRSTTDKKIAGVCGGIGNYLDIDPTFVRLAYVAFIFLSFGAGVVLYFLLLFLMPEERIPEVKKA